MDPAPYPAGAGGRGLKPAAGPFFLDRAAWVLLWAFIFSLPLEKALEIPGAGTLTRAAGLAAFAAGTAAAARRRTLRMPNTALLLAAAYVLWSGLTYFWSLTPYVTAVRVATLAQLLGMLWLIWELCRTPAAQSWLMRAYVAGACVSSALTVSRYARGQQTNYRRYATSGFDPNDLGITLALAMPMALYLAYRSRGRAAWLYRLGAALAMAAVLLTGSRAALVAVCLGFAFVAFTWRTATRAQRIGTLALAGLLVLGLVRLAPQPARQRLATLPTELTRGTLHDRTRIWKSGVKALKRHWFAGVGVGAYPEAVRPWLGRSPAAWHQYVAHNTFLSVLVETGVVGFFVFGLLLAVLVLFIWMLAPAERAHWFTCLAVWAAGVSTLTWETRKPTWLLFALIMTAWAQAFRAQEQEP